MQITFVGDPRGRNAVYLAQNPKFDPSDPAFATVDEVVMPLNKPVEVDDKWLAKHGKRLIRSGHYVVDGKMAKAEAVAPDEDKPAPKARGRKPKR